MPFSPRLGFSSFGKGALLIGLLFGTGALTYSYLDSKNLIPERVSMPDSSMNSPVTQSAKPTFLQSPEECAFQKFAEWKVSYDKKLVQDAKNFEAYKQDCAKKQCGKDSPFGSSLSTCMSLYCSSTARAPKPITELQSVNLKSKPEVLAWMKIMAKDPGSKDFRLRMGVILQSCGVEY